MVLIQFQKERQVRIDAELAKKNPVTFIHLKTLARKSDYYQFKIAKLHVRVLPLLNHSKLARSTILWLIFRI